MQILMASMVIVSCAVLVEMLMLSAYQGVRMSRMLRKADAMHRQIRKLNGRL